jgi:hypothetical protein
MFFIILLILQSFHQCIVKGLQLSEVTVISILIFPLLFSKQLYTTSIADISKVSVNSEFSCDMVDFMFSTETSLDVEEIC